MSDNDNVKVRYARGTGRNLGKADNKSNTWEGFKTLLRKVRRTAEKMAEYDKYDADDQAELKRARGFWFAAATTLGVRKRGQLLPRLIWSLDLDSLTPETLAQIRAQTHPLTGYEMIAHPTRGDREHKDKPRLRAAVLLAREVTEEEYEGLSRINAFVLFGDDGFDQVDSVTHRAGQLMFNASISNDQPWEVIEFSGAPLDMHAVAEQWGLDTHGDKDAWLNPTLWPRKTGEMEYRATQAKAQNPLEKTGIIGAFCRAYTIYEAIDEFIPDVYSPVDQSWGGKDRYTYNYGHASAGVEVQDGGLFIYSHHGSDPCGDMLCNAFDMVRRHKFGDLDGELPDEGAADGPKITSRPSYKAMIEWARTLEPVLAEYSGPSAFSDDDFTDEDVETGEPAAQINTDAPISKATTTYDADIEELLGPSKEEKPKPTLLEKMNARHAVAVVGGDTVILNTSSDEVTYSSPTDLRTLYANKKMPKANGQEYTRADWWLEQDGRLTYVKGVVFAPGRNPKGAYNLFRGWKVEPKAGSCQLILDHILYKVCRGNREHYHWFIGFLAHMVQKPQEKPGVAVVLKGLKGTGKDTVGDYIGRILGRYRVKIAQMEQLTGKFNTQLQFALFIHVEEAIWAGDHRAIGPLKNIITSEVIRIEPKGVDSFEVPSCSRLFMTSNEDFVVPATGDERRFAVFEVSDEMAVLAGSGREGELKAKAYFDALVYERDNGGAEALLHVLLNYDISDVNVRRPPNTAALTGQKLIGLRGVERWLLDVLERGELPKSTDPAERMSDDENTWGSDYQLVRMTVWWDAYRAWSKTQRFEGRDPALNAFGRKIGEILGSRIRALQRRVGKTQVRLHEIAPLNECRAAFSEHFRAADMTWGDDIPEEPDLIG